jgi:hypothetical protein
MARRKLRAIPLRNDLTVNYFFAGAAGAAGTAGVVVVVVVVVAGVCLEVD